MRLSDGIVYDEPLAALDNDELAWPSASTCLWPTLSQVSVLAQHLRERGVHTAVSIGCGDGAAEALLEKCGLHVHAVDLDVLRDTRLYATSFRRFCKSIVRIRPDALFRIPDPLHSALCFFWGRNSPWQAYLEEYAHVPIVVLAGEPANEGDDCATEPRANALHHAHDWQLIGSWPVRAVHGGAMWSIYKRCSCPNDGGIVDGHDGVLAQESRQSTHLAVDVSITNDPSTVDDASADSMADSIASARRSG